jgi:hypothetical protein
MGFVKTGTSTTLGVIDPKKVVKRPVESKPVKPNPRPEVKPRK